MGKEGLAGEKSDDGWCGRRREGDTRHSRACVGVGESRRATVWLSGQTVCLHPAAAHHEPTNESPGPRKGCNGVLKGTKRADCNPADLVQCEFRQPHSWVSSARVPSPVSGHGHQRTRARTWSRQTQLWRRSISARLRRGRCSWLSHRGHRTWSRTEASAVPLVWHPSKKGVARLTSRSYRTQRLF